MSKKTLPKAIVRISDATRENGASGPPSGDINERSAGRTPSLISSAAANIVEIAPKREALSTIVANDIVHGTSPHGTPEMRQRSIARAIVERHANFSAIVGAIPLPIVNAASVSAIILRMLKALSRHYGVPFEHDRARKIVVGLTGGAMPAGLAAVTTSTLSYIVPGSNLLGLAVCSVAASACTRGIGRMFIELFENGATWHDISAPEKY